MDWDFDDCGEWEAESEQRCEDGLTLSWRIAVCEDGTFSVQVSDCELVNRREPFPTLKEAKDFCEASEAKARGVVIVCTTDAIIEAFTGVKVAQPDEALWPKPTQELKQDQSAIDGWFQKNNESEGVS